MVTHPPALQMTSSLARLEWRIPLRHVEGFCGVLRLGSDFCLHWNCLNDNGNLSEMVSNQMRHDPGQSCAECLDKTMSILLNGIRHSVSRLHLVAPGRAVYITAWKEYWPM